MNIQTIAEHSIDLDLLQKDSIVLDLGCRNFGWSTAMLEYVDKVYCWDADNDISTPDSNRLPLNWGAVADIPGMRQFVRYGNGTGNFVLENEGPILNSDIINVPCFTIEDIASLMNFESFDLIKMDIEGMEYGVLSSLNRPISKQISFELHEHTEKKKGKTYVEKMLRHLEQWYSISYTDYSCKHGCGLNWWDVLIIQK